jgi:membrane-bound lytic murein transglycosylase D
MISLQRFLPRRSPLCLLAAVFALLHCLPAGAAGLDTNLNSLPELRISEPGLKADEVLTNEDMHGPAPLSKTVDLTAPTDDLWVRVRNGFAMPNLNDDLVLQHQQWYLSHPDYLRRIVDRSRLYLYHIVTELEKRGMPTELALLPMVESAYNPMAYSRSRASGLWQFIPSTGRNFKLEQNWWQDQRRDIVASTGAALDYLQSVYEMHGDWQLALASYNWGEGAVARAISKNEAKGLPADYANLTLPNETRNYVPKLQALKNIFANPVLVAELGLGPLPNRPYFMTIDAPGTIDVKVAAKLADISVDEFMALNPQHNRPVITSDSQLVLPADKVDTFRTNLENTGQPLSAWSTYSVKPGEKLENIAPRFGISLNDLKRVNGLQGRLPSPGGLTLLVPAHDGSGAGAINDSLADRLEEQPTYVAASAGSRTHTVGRGDTFYSIAHKYGISVAELRRANPSHREKSLRAGARLDIPGGGRAEAPPRESTARSSASSAKGKSGKTSARTSSRASAKSSSRSSSSSHTSSSGKKKRR